ncbi:uncharacterized protein LOC112088973 [Eutrema salsugineum]|uniref:uncharacterized protein LOC112088973 n=1 Tax=Eutrema salsugineum TaxID=72664 RepID=UPI000CED0E07|nr:uncharacterized protein LOC112088973 [Eutrema salsugineum]
MVVSSVGSRRQRRGLQRCRWIRGGGGPSSFVVGVPLCLPSFFPASLPLFSHLASFSLRRVSSAFLLESPASDELSGFSRRCAGGGCLFRLQSLSNFVREVSKWWLDSKELLSIPAVQYWILRTNLISGLRDFGSGFWLVTSLGVVALVSPAGAVYRRCLSAVAQDGWLGGCPAGLSQLLAPPPSTASVWHEIPMP